MKEVRDYVGHYVYPINRLDRPVSGIVLFALAPEYVNIMQTIWHTSQVKKLYLALTRGLFKKKGTFDFPLGDHNKVKKESVTNYSPL